MCPDLFNIRRNSTARIDGEGDMHFPGLSAKLSGNSPSGIVTKPPKPVSSVSAVPTWGIFRIFWAAFIGGGNFSAVSPGQGLGVQRGGGPTRSLNGFSQGGGDVWYCQEGA